MANKPYEEEIAVYESQFSKALTYLPNPDPVLKKIGLDISVYRQIWITDSHIRGVYTQRFLALLSKKWRVEPYSDSEKDRKISEFVKEVLQDINLRKKIKQLLFAIHYGYYISELIWEKKDGKWIITDLRGRPPEWFNFNAEGELQFIGEVGLKRQKVPEDKFCIVVYDMEDDNNPYGTPLAASLYWMWFFKKYGFKNWAIKAEKFGMPFLLGKYPPGTSEEDKKNLETALNSMVRDAVAVIEETMNIDTIEAKGSAAAELYESLIRACNSEISKAVLGQTLTTEIGERGSYAAAGVHLKVRQDIIESDAKLIEEAINEYVIWPLVKYNFGDEFAPRFVIETEEEEIKTDKARRDYMLWQMGVRFPKSYIESEYGIPSAQENEEVLPTPAEVRSGMFSENKGIKIEFAEDEGDKRVFKRGTELDKLYESAMSRAKKAFEKIYIKFKKEIEKMENEKEMHRLLYVLDRDTLSEIESVFFDTVFTSYLKGRADVIEDISEQREFAGFEFEPMRFDTAIRFFKDKIPVNPEFFYQLEAELRPKFFTVSRVESLDLITGIYERLYKTLEEGGTFRDFKNRVDEFFSATGRTPLNPFHLETVFRTNIQMAYHAGKYEQLTDPEVKDIIAYWRYSAILDERTRPSHAQMHGYTAPPDDPVWKTWYPPNGFNCRCDVVAITKRMANKMGIKPSKRPVPEADKDWAFNLSEALRGWGEEELVDIEDFIENFKNITYPYPPLCEEFGILSFARRGCRGKIPVDSLPEGIKLLPEGESIKYYTDYLKEQFGFEKGWFKTYGDYYLYFDLEKFAQKLKVVTRKDPKRLSFISLLKPTLEFPHEIVYQIQLFKKTKRTRWTLNFIRNFNIAPGELFVVTSISRNGLIFVTFYPQNFGESSTLLNLKDTIKEIRFGWLWEKRK